MTLTEAQPWLQREGESTKAYSAFRVYLEQGPDHRSLRSVAAHLGKSYTLIGRWSSRDEWAERTSAWDAHMLAVAQAAIETEISEMSKRHVSMAVAIQNQIAKRLQEFDAGELTPAQMVQWFEVATRIERAARGLPDLSIEQLRPTDASTEPIDPEKVVQLSDWLMNRERPLAPTPQEEEDDADQS